MTFLSHSQFPFLTLFLFLLLCFLTSFSFCQSNSPQNIEVVFPKQPPPPPPPPAISPSDVPTPSPTTKTNVKHKTSKKVIAAAVGVTAASTLVASALLFFLCTAYAGQRKKYGNAGAPKVSPYATTATSVAAVAAERMEPMTESGFTRFDGNVRGLIVDEDGLDVLYWRKLEGSQRNNKSGPFHEEVFSKNKPPSGKLRSFPRGKSSSSSPSSSDSNTQVHPKDDQKLKLLDSKLPSSSDNVKVQDVGNSHDNAPVQTSRSVSVAATQLQTKTPPAPPPPVPMKAPPPPMPARKGPALPPPPPPPRGGSASATSKPPPAPKKSPSGRLVEVSALGGENASEDKTDQVKLKPLHWEKVNVVNRDHSMVWDKLDRGSFQYNGDMIEALFGTVAASRKSSNGNDSSAANKTAPNPVVKISILDSRRSQNIAIVIRSLGISRQELIDGLSEGRGLNIEILEKLTRMAPTREETAQILAFDGEVDRLANAESFLYHVLKAVPSGFTRVNAMLFRYAYGSEIQQLTDTLQTLDAACTELRSRGVFLKLLEAILKAGNRLNAGTARGDAKAFNLTALTKLLDYKSSDGKTTLLHFVVHEVVRNEGRRCVMNRNKSLSRSNSQKSASSSIPNSGQSNSKEDQEKEFLKLGLPIVGGLSSEFCNVKKAATIDQDTFTSTITSLQTRIAETRQLVLQCGADNGGGEFIKEMKEFLAESEGEIKTVQEEQNMVMEFIKKTTQYYQSGGFKDKQPLQMFPLVKDFLGMVDKACIDITRSLQQKKSNPNNTGSSASPSSPTSPAIPDALRTRVTFPRLPDHYLSERSGGSDLDYDH